MTEEEKVNDEAVAYIHGEVSAEVKDQKCDEIEEGCMENNGGEEPTQKDDPSLMTAPKRPAHFRNPDIHVGWRFGIPTFLIGTLVFLLVADISTGVSAKTHLIAPDGSLFAVNEILTVSIVSSVKELWNAESYALAIFICLTSVLWPYLKLILSLAAWMVPIKKIEKRERYIEILDSLDKWSFVDIFVLIIIMVAFNTTIELDSNINLDVLIIPKWGFHAFVAANMMSLMGTQAILYQHRRIQYHGEDNAKSAGEELQEQTQRDQKVALATQTNTSVPLLVFLLVSCFALHFAGCALDIYEVSNKRKDETFSVPYSVFSIGEAIPATAPDSSNFGMRWIQFMFMLFAVALPPWTMMLFSILYLLPMMPALKEKVFFLSEITFSWAAIEVFTLSAIFSILQLPKFGNGLIDNGCPQCYQVGSKLRPEFAVLCVSAVLNVGVGVWLFFRAHKGIYPLRESK